MNLLFSNRSPNIAINFSQRIKFATKRHSEYRPPFTRHNQDQVSTSVKKDISTGWKEKVSEKIAIIRTEWQRTEFFKEGGKHAENHNIRPQREFAIPKVYAIGATLGLATAIAICLYSDDVTESNSYFKMLKDKKSIDNSKEN